LSRRHLPTLTRSDAESRWTFGATDPDLLRQGVDAVLSRPLGRAPRARAALERGPPLLPPVRVLTPPGVTDWLLAELAHVWEMSALRSDVQTFPNLLATVDPPCQRFLLGNEADVEVTPGTATNKETNVRPYSFSAQAKKDLFRCTDPKELSLPPPREPGMRRVRVEDFINAKDKAAKGKERDNKERGIPATRAP